MDWLSLANIKLRAGKGGGDPRNGLCIMEMVDYFNGADRVTDHPQCACLALTHYAISLNDRAPSQEDRDSLKPLLPLLSGSRDSAAEKKRAEYLVRETCARIVAPVLAGRWPEHAATIEDAARDGSLTELRMACLDAANDAAAYAAAYAAANAAATAANDAAYAAAYAAAAIAAAIAANAAATAANAAARRAIWFTQKAILDGAIKLGAHGRLDIASVPAREAQLMALLNQA